MTGKFDVRSTREGEFPEKGVMVLWEDDGTAYIGGYDPEFGWFTQDDCGMTWESTCGEILWCVLPDLSRLCRGRKGQAGGRAKERGEEDLQDAFAELDRVSDELTTPGPFGGERSVSIRISESRTRALDFNNDDSSFRYQVTIKPHKGEAIVGYGPTRTDAILRAVRAYEQKKAKNE